MSEIAERLNRFKDQVDGVVTALEGDGSSSPVLVAVVKELQKKTAKAIELVGDGGDAREAVVEVEQAADSAKAAAEADGGLSEASRTAVVEAHDRICVMKTKMG